MSANNPTDNSERLQLRKATKKYDNWKKYEHKVMEPDLRFFDDWKRDNDKSWFDESRYANYLVYIMNHEVNYKRMISDSSAMGQPIIDPQDELFLTTELVSLKLLLIRSISSRQNLC